MLSRAAAEFVSHLLCLARSAQRQAQRLALRCDAAPTLPALPRCADSDGVLTRVFEANERRRVDEAS
eukprot:1940992-Pleurochrysis_carterae.AAC.1